jgi:class 3 adenylate cyclase
MGINLGDIAVEDGDFFGDGVNVAAGLKGLAEPRDRLVACAKGQPAAPPTMGDHSLRASRPSISRRKGPQQFLR